MVDTLSGPSCHFINSREGKRTPQTRCLVHLDFVRALLDNYTINFR